MTGLYAAWPSGKRAHAAEHPRAPAKAPAPSDSKKMLELEAHLAAIEAKLDDKLKDNVKGVELNKIREEVQGVERKFEMKLEDASIAITRKCSEVAKEQLAGFKNDGTQLEKIMKKAEEQLRSENRDIVDFQRNAKEKMRADEERLAALQREVSVQLKDAERKLQMAESSRDTVGIHKAAIDVSLDAVNGKLRKITNEVSILDEQSRRTIQNIAEVKADMTRQLDDRCNRIGVNIEAIDKKIGTTEKKIDAQNTRIEASIDERKNHTDTVQASVRTVQAELDGIKASMTQIEAMNATIQGLLSQTGSVDQNKLAAIGHEYAILIADIEKKQRAYNDRVQQVQKEFADSIHKDTAYINNQVHEKFKTAVEEKRQTLLTEFDIKKNALDTFVQTKKNDLEAEHAVNTSELKAQYDRQLLEEHQTRAAYVANTITELQTHSNKLKEGIIALTNTKLQELDHVFGHEQTRVDMEGGTFITISQNLRRELFDIYAKLTEMKNSLHEMKLASESKMHPEVEPGVDKEIYERDQTALQNLINEASSRVQAIETEGRASKAQLLEMETSIASVWHELDKKIGVRKRMKPNETQARTPGGDDPMG